MRALGERSLFPVLHRGELLPAPVGARAVKPAPLASAPGTSAGDPAGGKPAGGARLRRVEEKRPGSDHRRHHGAAEERAPPDRREASCSPPSPIWRNRPKKLGVPLR